MRAFDTYEEAVAFARAYANEHRQSMYIRTGPFSFDPVWVVGMLPRPENRYGWERLVEAVEPE